MLGQSTYVPTALSWILLFAFVIRVATVIPAHIDGSCSDEKEYLFLAHQMLDGKGFVDSNGDYSIKAPLFPFLIAVCMKAGEGLQFLPYLLVALVGTLSVYVSYLLAAALWVDRRRALFAAGLVAFFPPLVLYGALLMSESLFILLLIVTLLLVERLTRTDRISFYILFGIVAGLAVLTRAVFLGLVPLLLVSAGIVRRRNGAPVGRLFIAFGVWCLVLLPWTVRNYTVHHAFIPVSTFGGRSLLIGNNPYAHGTAKLDPGYDDWLASKLKARGFSPHEVASEAKEASLETAIALEYVAAHPGRFLVLAVQKAHVYWIYPITHRADVRILQASFMGFDALLLFCVVAGTAAISFKLVRFRPIWLTIAFFTGVHMILYAEARYRLPLLPLFCVLAAGSPPFLQKEWRRDFPGNRHRRLILLAGSTGVVLVYLLTGLLFLMGEIS
jgi:4-amino-4-deoxy-L-arabinose transferase-like glycosyltransferase